MRPARPFFESRTAPGLFEFETPALASRVNFIDKFARKRINYWRSAFDQRRTNLSYRAQILAWNWVFQLLMKLNGIFSHQMPFPVHFCLAHKVWWNWPPSAVFFNPKSRGSADYLLNSLKMVLVVILWTFRFHKRSRDSKKVEKHCPSVELWMKVDCRRKHLDEEGETRNRQRKFVLTAK